MTSNQYRVYMGFVTTWNRCTHFGTINSRVDRINDVPKHLEKLEVTYLIPYLLIDERAQAFVYNADLTRVFVSNPNLGWIRKNPIQIVEIYQDLCPRATEWWGHTAQIALRLDVALMDGLDNGVAVPDFVVPFAQTAQEEAILSNSDIGIRVPTSAI